ncbi:hypothetical protein BDQ12DRAFT_720743 [Crucibulum laeve]|uniref:Uncharacterized protein n=1 Tax=Crucibulum laeve TaxID=68775 RepID=A0A5C3M6S2_9AGAR|nr:hypothetical protein BDQ12DRAFT_720743 [Crucibulum laeve]
MSSGTSTVSIAQQTPPNVFPTRTTITATPSPTVFDDAAPLYPRNTPPPVCCAPNEVVIHLATTLVIHNFDRYWDIPIRSFQPVYLALEDGSLITPPFSQDLWNANLSLLVTGALAMLFTRNIFVSGDYLRRGKVKRKTLFYILFISQLLAPISLIPVILSYFYKSLNCTIVIILSCVSGTVSLALLITGILGVKAYKCLNNPRSVFFMLILFQCASTITVGFDVATTSADRRISGSCVRTSDLQYTRLFVSIQFLESLFICCCFFFACWKSRGSPAARGRISLELSMEELPIEIPSDANDATQSTKRGWWDYVPTPEKISSTGPPVKISLLQRFKATLSGNGANKPQRMPLRKPSKPEDLLSIQPPRRSTIRISESSVNERPENYAARGRNSPTPSSGSRLSRLIPRMELFREVMKDELFYTTFITTSCVIVAVLALIGVNFKNGLTVTGWIALNWGIISVLAMHSFGRVVRRHERDALLTHPVTCTAIARAANANIAAREQEAREREARMRAQTTVSVVSSRMRLRRDTKDYEDDDPNNPFSDIRRLEHDRVSWNSSVYSATSPASSRPPSPLVSVRPASQMISSNLSSLQANFPSSGRGTPLVPHDSSDGTSLEGFSQSWLLARQSALSGNVESSEKGKAVP